MAAKKTTHACSKEEEISEILTQQAVTQEKQNTFNDTVKSIDKKIGWFMAAFVTFMSAFTIAMIIGSINIGRYLDKTDRLVTDVHEVSGDVKDLQKEMSTVKTTLGEVKQWMKFNQER